MTSSIESEHRVPDFLPFRGLRYRGGDLSHVTAPPYDVIDDDERHVLEGRDPCNSVQLILPRDGAHGDRYAAAAETLARWCEDGTLVAEDAPAFYAYRMAFEADDGSRATTTGVIGALGLPARAGEGDVLPHERTMPKARSDRLALLRATRANLDPIWGLSLADGLTAAIESARADEPVAHCVDDDGTRHELTLVTDPRAVEAVAGLVAGAPVVLADGHHRFETAIAHRDEAPGAPGAGAIMTLVVELADEQLAVHPIHRVLSGVDDLRASLADTFDVEPVGPNEAEGVRALVARLGAEDAFGLVDEDGLALLRPREGVLAGARAELPEPLHDVDAARFEVTVKPRLGGATLGYRADAVTVAALVEKGAADAAVLLRPCSVEAIRAAAFAGVRMPEKTTYFAPKPRTGMVFRSLDA